MFEQNADWRASLGTTGPVLIGTWSSGRTDPVEILRVVAPIVLFKEAEAADLGVIWLRGEYVSAPLPLSSSRFLVLFRVSGGTFLCPIIVGELPPGEETVSGTFSMKDVPM